MSARVMVERIGSRTYPLDSLPQWQLTCCHDYQASPCMVGQEMSVIGMQGGTGVK